MIMAAQLPVRLQLLIPAVENAIAGNAYRPGDVFKTRKGAHRDRQHRRRGPRDPVRCAGLCRRSQPELMIDLATLTGAARVANALLQAGTKTQDPLWRMPLWRPYLILLAGSSRHAGAISAALFLERFVPERFPWCHLDVYSWNDSARPGRPRGGEAQGLRAYIDFLKQRYPA
jgi:leucyl aminopeptidase